MRGDNRKGSHHLQSKAVLWPDRLDSSRRRDKQQRLSEDGCCVLTMPRSSSPTQEMCLCDSPAVMTLVDGPTEESDNLICVAYRHQFDVVNESTGEAFRLHHVEANKVS